MKPLSVRKRPHLCFFSFEKKQRFLKSFRKLLYSLGFEDWQAEAFARPKDEHGDPTDKEYDIDTIVDRHTFFENDDFTVDVIFGHKKVFMTIYSREDRQIELGEKVDGFF